MCVVHCAAESRVHFAIVRLLAPESRVKMASIYALQPGVNMSAMCAPYRAVPKP